MIKKVITSAGTQEGEAVRLLDFTNGIDLNNYGMVKIADPNDELKGIYQPDQEIEIQLGEHIDGQEVTDTMFNGVIDDVIEEDELIVYLAGYGRRLQAQQYRKSYNQVKAAAILRDIMGPTGIAYQLGSITEETHHTHICPNGTSLREIQRVNTSFNLQLNPYFDRRGVLQLKTRAEAVRATDVEYTGGQFYRFERGQLEAPLDEEIEAMDRITVLGSLYLVTAHRIYHEQRKTASFITLAKV